MRGRMVRKTNVPTATRETQFSAGRQCVGSFREYSHAAGPVRRPPSHVLHRVSRGPHNSATLPARHTACHPLQAPQKLPASALFRGAFLRTPCDFGTDAHRRGAGNLIEDKRSQPSHAARTSTPFHTAGLHPTSCPCPKDPPSSSTPPPLAADSANTKLLRPTLVSSAAPSLLLVHVGDT